MRDVFYTVLIVWIIWRVFSAFQNIKYKSNSNSKSSNINKQRTTGATTVEYVPPKKKNLSDDEGEYVDFEEVK